MIKTIFSICFSLILCVTLDAQQNSFDPTRPGTVIPPSAEVSSLLKDIDVPVSYYTGTAQFSLPLWTVSSGTIALPISLSYSATGVKVEEDASWVGIGWTMNSGGLIGLSSSASGKSGQLSYTQTANKYQMPDYSTGDVAEQAWLNNMSVCNKFSITQGFSNLMPDTYFLNFNGNSAKVFFDKQDNVFITPYKPWKISRNTTGTKSFTIITENGTIYKFELIEHTTTIISSTSSDYLSQKEGDDAWFLTKIISSNYADTISLDYVPMTYNQSSKNAEETNQSLLPGQIVPAHMTAPPPVNISSTTMDQHFNTYLIKSINSKNQRIDFISSAGRLDIDNTFGGNTNKLDTIKIFRKYNDTVQFVKQFCLSYEYSNSTALLATNKRLFLDSIIENGAGAKIKKYVFGYNGKLNLPSRNSKSQDFWGFFNGASNATLIPILIDPKGTLTDGANRTANPLNADAGVLSKITFPTGGCDSMEYEINDYSYAQGGAPKGTDSILVNQSISANANINSIHSEKTFQLTFDQYISISYTIKELRPGGDGFAAVSLSNITDAGHPKILINAGGVSGTYSFPASFYSAGTYKITSDVVFSSEMANISVNYLQKQFKKINALNAKYAGGVRIKRLIQYNGFDHANDIVKRFSYQLNDSTSSGFLNNYPVYSSIEYTPKILDGGTLPILVGYWNYFVRHSSSQTALGGTHGSSVGYTKVTVLYGNSGENGKEELYYNNSPVDSGVNAYPYAPKSNYDDLRGLLSKKIIYDNNSVAIQKTTNTYDFNNAAGKPNFKWIYGVKIGQDHSDIIFDANNCPLGQATFKSTYFKIFQFWPVLSSSSDTMIDKGNRIISSITNYYYDPLTTQIVKQQTFKSDNSIKFRLYKYPTNFSTLSPYNEMVNRNNIASVVEQVDSNITVNKELSRIKTNYIFWQGNAFIQPASVQKSIGGNLLETEMTIDSYDSKGNITQVTSKDHITTCYFWGYNGLNMVAQLKGIDYNTAKQFINQSLLDNTSSLITDDQIRIELNKLRINIPKAFIITYTYRPLIGLTSLTNINGRIEYYEYDELNRLSLIRDQDKNILKIICYNYAGQVENCSGSFLNTVQTGAVYTRNNCGAGFISGTYISTVVANTYSSFLSVADANQKAQTYLSSVGQNNANTYGSCTPIYYNTAQTGPSYNRNNCSAGYLPGAYITTVAANAYSSLLSIADANQQAQNYITSVGQTNANTYGTCTQIFYNTLQSGYPYTRNNCGAGYTAGTYITTVAANTYSSTLSVADANQQAQNYITSVGQSNANQYATCTPTSVGCTFAMASGMGSPTSNVTSTPTTTSFYLVFYSTSYLMAGPTYLIATISAGCRPSTTRTIAYSSGGRNMTITINSLGQLYLQIASGSAMINANTATSLGSTSFSK